MSKTFVRVALKCLDVDEIQTILCTSKGQAQRLAAEIVTEPSVDSAWVSSIRPEDVPFEPFIPISNYAPAFVRKQKSMYARFLRDNIRDCLELSGGVYRFSKIRAAKMLRNEFGNDLPLSEIIDMLRANQAIVDDWWVHYANHFPDFMAEKFQEG